MTDGADANYDAVIVGGGPAGAACAQWLSMLGFRAVVVDRRTAVGGLQADSPYLNQWIPTLAEGTRGVDVAAALHASLLRHGVHLRLGCPVEDIAATAAGFEVATGLGMLRGRHLVLATGVRPEDGGLSSSPSVLIGPGHAVAAADVAGKRVAILGGGDNAFENYLFLRDRGAAEVTIFARGLRARAEFLAKVPARDVRLGAYGFDADRMEVDGRPYDLAIALYGWRAALPPMPGLEIETDARGFVRTGPDCETNLEGVFAIGEVTRRAHPCSITSMADGVVAAKAIQRRLEAGALHAYIAALQGCGEASGTTGIDPASAVLPAA